MGVPLVLLLCLRLLVALAVGAVEPVLDVAAGYGFFVEVAAATADSAAVPEESAAEVEAEPRVSNAVNPGVAASFVRSPTPQKQASDGSLPQEPWSARALSRKNKAFISFSASCRSCWVLPDTRFRSSFSISRLLLCLISRFLS